MRNLRAVLPSPSALLAFVAAARLGSFTRAAAELGGRPSEAAQPGRRHEGEQGARGRQHGAQVTHKYNLSNR